MPDLSLLRQLINSNTTNFFNSLRSLSIKFNKRNCMEEFKAPFIIRSPHDIKNRYTVVSNRLINDKNLSFGAKGLMLYFLSCRDDKRFSFNKTHNEFKQTLGKDALKTLFDELMRKNYMVRIKTISRGVKDFVYYIYEEKTHDSEAAQEHSKEKKPLETHFSSYPGFTNTKNPHGQQKDQPHTSLSQEIEVYTQKQKCTDQDVSLYIDAFIKYLKTLDPNYPINETSQWEIAFRKLLKQVGASKTRILQLLDWLPYNEFWRTHINTPDALRRYYSKLVHIMLSMDEAKFQQTKEKAKIFLLAKKRKALVKEKLAGKFTDKFSRIDVDTSDDTLCKIHLHGYKNEYKCIELDYYKEDKHWAALQLV